MSVICYHRGCPDGFTAAWLIRRWLLDEGTDIADIELVGAMYGEDPPLVNDDYYIVDFCYEPDQLRQIKGYGERIVILDHHETSRAWMVEVFPATLHFMPSRWAPDANLIVSDFTLSGAGLAATFTDQWYPFVRHVQDRDLWRFDLEGTNEVFAAITSRPYTIEAWDELASMDRWDLVAEGRSINRYREQIIEATVATAHEITVGSLTFTAAASPYAIGSDVAGRLAAASPEKFAGYWVPYGDRIRYGLRSTEDGPNVAEMAAQFGGGGHPHAAGFEVEV